MFPAYWSTWSRSRAPDWGVMGGRGRRCPRRRQEHTDKRPTTCPVCGVPLWRSRRREQNSSETSWMLHKRCHSIPFYSIPFRSILFYSDVFHSILFYSVLFHSFLFRSIPFHFILFCSVRFYSILFYSDLL